MIKIWNPEVKKSDSGETSVFTAYFDDTDNSTVANHTMARHIVNEIGREHVVYQSIDTDNLVPDRELIPAAISTDSKHPVKSVKLVDTFPTEEAGDQYPRGCVRIETTDPQDLKQILLRANGISEHSKKDINMAFGNSPPLAPVATTSYGGKS